MFFSISTDKIFHREIFCFTPIDIYLLEYILSTNEQILLIKLLDFRSRVKFLNCNRLDFFQISLIAAGCYCSEFSFNKKTFCAFVAFLTFLKLFCFSCEEVSKVVYKICTYSFPVPIIQCFSNLTSLCLVGRHICYYHGQILLPPEKPPQPLKEINVFPCVLK